MVSGEAAWGDLVLVNVHESDIIFGLTFGLMYTFGMDMMDMRSSRGVHSFTLLIFIRMTK